MSSNLFSATGESSMQYMAKKLVKMSLVVLPFSLLVGCATTADLEKVRATAEEARATANQAAATASEAKTMAAQGQECCAEVKEGMDRMFRRSMRK
jgi:Alanine-zipper, major outer membrane lipoprotein